MDIRARLLAARMSVRIENNREYCDSIGIKDRSGFKTKKQQRAFKAEGSADEK